MRRISRTLTLSACIGTLVAGAAAPMAQAVDPSSADVAQKASQDQGDQPSSMLYGLNNNPDTVKDDDINQAVGKAPATKVLFHEFTQDEVGKAKSDLENTWDSGSVPILTWELQEDRNDKKSHLQEIETGQKDDLIRQEGDMLKEFTAGPDGKSGTDDDRQVYLRLGHEMNGDWYSWGANDQNSPNDYVSAFQHVHQQFDQVGGLDKSHLQYMWIPMSMGGNGIASSSNKPGKDYYPGDDYVDWVGVDAYNRNSGQGWQQPKDVLDKSLKQVSEVAPNKPIAIPEIGTNEGDGKNQWMNDMWGTASYFTGANGEKVKMLDYFNNDKNEGKSLGWTKWSAVDRDNQDHGGNGGDKHMTGASGDPLNVYSAFVDNVNKDNMIGADGQKHLTDDQFQGNF